MPQKQNRPSPKRHAARKRLGFTRTNVLGLILVIVGVGCYFAVVFIDSIAWAELRELLGGNIWQMVAILIGILLVALGGVLIRPAGRTKEANSDSTSAPPNHTNHHPANRVVKPHASTKRRVVETSEPAPPPITPASLNDTQAIPKLLDNPPSEVAPASNTNGKEIYQGASGLDENNQAEEPVNEDDIAAIDRYIDETRESLYSAKTVIKICCQNCGTLNDDHARFCDQCGHELKVN